MTGPEKKLLVVFEFDTLNGGENSILAVVPLLIEAGWSVTALWPGPTPSATDAGSNNRADKINTLAGALDLAGAEKIVLPTHDPSGARKSQERYRDDLAKILMCTTPDLVLCNSLSTSRLCGPVTKRLMIPSAGYLRDIIKLSRKAVSDVNELDRIFAVSQATMNFHAAQGMDAGKIRVIYNGVDLEQFHPRNRTSPTALKKGLSIPETSPVVLFVGQIGMRKGIDVLVEAFGQVLPTSPDAHLVIIGQRHSQKQEARAYESSVAHASQQPPLAGRVHWLGRQTNVADWMAASRVLLHPARQEPLGRVILEAAASGLPIVTTLVGGSPEILGCNDSFDLLCNKDDAAALAMRTGQLLIDGQLWQSVSRELRNLAVRRFDRHTCARALAWNLNDLL